MPKKLLLFIYFILFIIINNSLGASIENNLIPLKKPKLTDKELKQKVLINILKPLPKPGTATKKVLPKKTVEKETKTKNK